MGMTFIHPGELANAKAQVDDERGNNSYAMRYRTPVRFRQPSLAALHAGKGGKSQPRLHLSDSALVARVDIEEKPVVALMLLKDSLTPSAPRPFL